MKKLFLALTLSLVLIPVSLLAETKTTRTKYVFDRPSTVGFKAKGTLHDINGETEVVTGLFELDLENLDKPGRGVIEIQTKTLNTKNRKRDKIMRKQHLETTTFPLIRFVIVKSKLEFNDPEQKKADYILTGELELHGVRRNIQFIATLDYKRKDNLTIEGYVPLEMIDYDIAIPSFAKMFKVKNKVRVVFNLTAVPE